ncbi:MAG: hypothetical protein PHI97_05020 [Desulfobulbus sp.]|nr:hypothetical protein [Desulfobulbus sp.]
MTHLPPSFDHAFSWSPAAIAEKFRHQLLARQDELPFSSADTTVGIENEFQVAVEGNKTDVDLALTLIHSNYYQNLKARAGRGDLSPHQLAELNTFLDEGKDRTWENSWVRFPRRLLGPYAGSILKQDLLADKADPQGATRQDLDQFIFTREGEPWLRTPVSYLLKLSLAEAIGSWQPLDETSAQSLRRIGEQLMEHLISDNSSPEITSFSLSKGENGELPGRETARETSRRFIFLQLLIQYANREFRLQQYGQTCRMYMAPNPPFRQKQLNELISDQFYRELFLNPCLSGWQKGESKKQYMGLCHRTLSRSQLNTIAKLKEAGIITNNLVVLPNTSSTSLANNGTHITLGSRILSQSFRESEGMLVEKYFGDLVIKIVEHFLPLFVTTCSAAPYRLGFSDFHPEKVLGYLPHELDYSHLRMLWRRWKKKADLRFCGHSFTPVGPLWLDRLTSGVLRLRGDYLPDVRLIDYLVALHSVDHSPALNGQIGNHERLKTDLTEMGVFDSRMAIYLPYRMRNLGKYGFSGFEGRHYSLFPDLSKSLALAVNLQTLVTSMAYRWVIEGTITHADIPDDPCTESERRQIFFASAIGLPTVFIRANTGSQVLKRILSLVERQRPSRRYRGYIRIEVNAYQQACLKILRNEEGCGRHGPDCTSLLDSLDAMLKREELSAAARLTGAILGKNGRGTDPMRIKSDEFNRMAERYYRGDLCRLHLDNGLDTLVEDGLRFDAACDAKAGALKQQLIGPTPTALFIRETGCRLLAGEASDREIHMLIMLCLVLFYQQLQQQKSV